MASEDAKARGPRKNAVRWLAGVVLVAALAAAAVWFLARPPQADAFYTASLAPDATPGTLLAREPFTRRVPANGRGWRILYVTERQGEVALSSAVVVTPKTAAADPLPVIAWAHGTTGVATPCAPSLLPDPFDKVPDMAAIVAEGWAYVGTDYPGLGTDGGHTYLVGEDAARAVLDAVVAARQLADVALNDRVVVWGHSQGGHAALWTGMRARALAPELSVAGVAAFAPASDLSALAGGIRDGVFGKIVSAYLVTAFARTYPDVSRDAYVRPGTRRIADDIATRCAGGVRTIVPVLETFLVRPEGIFSRDPASGPFGARLAENTPYGPYPVPVLIAQGQADDLVVEEVQARYVAARCAEGQAIDYRAYPGRDHISLVAAESPLADEAIRWTRDRFAGRPATPNCPD